MGLFDRFRKYKAPERAVAKSAGDFFAQGLRQAEGGATLEAIQSFSEAIKLEPKLAIAYFHLGVSQLELGEAQLAIDAFREALLLKPDSAGAAYNIGNAQLMLGNLADAISAYERALQLKPGFADAASALQHAIDSRGDFVKSYFNQALAYQDERQLINAEAFYRKALILNPNHVDACNNLGVILQGEQRLAEALDCFAHAAELEPENTGVLANFSGVLNALEKKQEARNYLIRITELTPDDHSAWIKLGNISGDLDRQNEAVECYQMALRLDPNNAEANLNLGVLLAELEKLDDAEKCYRRVMELEPRNAVAHSNLGVVLKRNGLLQDALTHFMQAVRLQPDFSAAHSNMGTVLAALGQTEAAAVSYQRALELNPNSAEAYSNYGTVLHNLDRLYEAEVSYRKAIEINPKLAIAHNNLGIVYSHIRRMNDSVKCYEHAIQLKPDYADAYANLGGVLKDLGRLDDAVKVLNKALAIDPGCLIAHNNLLFVQNYVADQPAKYLLDSAKRFGEVVHAMANPFNSWPNTIVVDRRLRVGLVSGDLCSHPVGYFLESVLAVLKSSTNKQVDIYAYPCTSHTNDPTAQRLEGYCKAWTSAVGLSDEAFAKRIRDDRIDILIDLAGHTANSRLPAFAWRPAPVQISWLGYFATTGVAAIDYFIADQWTLPPDQENSFTEQIWRLPDTRLCFTPPDVEIEVNPLPALTKSHITFASFNNLSKVNDAVVALWSRVLHAVPGSQLFLKYQQLADTAIQKATRERFANYGVDPDRLIFEDYGPRAEYLAAYQRVDIGLDPFPFPGGTTTVEALWMGVPVLTLSGERFLSRQGVGLLMNAGLSEWIATDADDYVARAVKHASDLQGLNALRGNLRQQVLASPLFDARRFGSNFEIALRNMWIKWCACQLSSTLDESKDPHGTNRSN